MAGNEGRGIGAPAFVAGADLSSYQWHFVYLSADNTVSVCGTANQDSIGILRNKPDAAGKAADVDTVGKFSKVVLAETVTVGKELTTDASGHAEMVNGAGEYAGAKALQAGDAADIIEVIVVSGDMHASVE